MGEASIGIWRTSRSVPNRQQQRSLDGWNRLSHVPQLDSSDLFAKLASSCQFALITFSDRTSPASKDELQSVCSQWHGHVQMLNLAAPEHSRWSNIHAILVRPDQQVAWVAEKILSSASVAKSLD